MAMILCSECGEETLDQLNNCPICDQPLAKEKHPSSTGKYFFTYGGFALGGLALGTVCNMMGYTRVAMGLGVIALGSMVVTRVSQSRRSCSRIWAAVQLAELPSQLVVYDGNELKS